MTLLPTAPLVSNPAIKPLRLVPWTSGFLSSRLRLSGYSDWPMRMLAREHGASYTLCEVMLDQFLVSFKDREKNRHFLYNTEQEQPWPGS